MSADKVGDLLAQHFYKLITSKEYSVWLKQLPEINTTAESLFFESFAFESMLVLLAIQSIHNYSENGMDIATAFTSSLEKIVLAKNLFESVESYREYMRSKMANYDTDLVKSKEKNYLIPLSTRFCLNIGSESVEDTIPVTDHIVKALIEYKDIIGKIED